MLSPRRVVLVLHADTILAPKRESEAAGQALEQFEEFLKRPEPQATVVLVASTLDRRGRTAKLLLKEGTIVECGVIADIEDAQRWIRNRVAAAGVQIDTNAARLLARLGGTDVQRLRNDIDRLLLFVLGRKTIGEEDVREIAGPAALQDEWAMANAIESGNTAEALRQLALMLDAGARPEMVTGQLGWVARSKMPGGPARVPAAIDAVFRTDVALKSTGGDQRILLERLVVELCDAGKAARRPRS
jgi:DNA polymerase-3 subunit delta